MTKVPTQETISKATMAWLIEFLDEKGIELDDVLDIGEGHINFTVENLLDYIEVQDIGVMEGLQRKLVQIDFQNAPVKPFLEYLGKGFVGGLI